MANKEPHKVLINRGAHGFGFNIKGTTAEGGTMQAINGTLYPPLQYVSHVDEGGAAYIGGLRSWDRILEVNGNDVQGASHSKVVDLVIAGGSRLEMMVISVDESEAARLQRQEDALEGLQPAKPQTGSVHASVKDFSTIPGRPGHAQHTVYNVYVNGKYHCSRRYSEFENLHKLLKLRFKWFNFPPLPGKKLNGLTGTQLNSRETEERRLKLDEYVAICFGNEEIFKYEHVQKFLEATDFRPANAPLDDGNPSSPQSRNLHTQSNQAPQHRTRPAPGQPVPRPVQVVDPRTMPDKPLNQAVAKPTKTFFLPSRKPSSVALDKELETVGDLLNAILAKLGVTGDAANMFALFEVVGQDDSTTKPSKPTDTTFERILSTETPLGEVEGQILLQRWMFTKGQEAFFDEEESVVDLLFQQTAFEVGTGRLYTKANKKEALDKIEEEGEKLTYVKTARKVQFYGAVRFPRCASNYPEDNAQVVVTVDQNRIVIQTCDAEGAPLMGEDDVTVFAWEVINKVRRKDDVIGFKYKTDDDQVESIVFTTPHAEYMEKCIQRVMKEQEWLKQATAGADKEDGNFFRV